MRAVAALSVPNDCRKRDSRAGFLLALVIVAVAVVPARGQPGRAAALDLINDLQAPLLPQADGDPPDDAFAREVWFMTQAGELSSEEAAALAHEARKTQARWGFRIGDSTSAEPLRRELSLLLKDISRPAWEKVKAERDRLTARQRRAALLERVVELDEALVLLSEQRAKLGDDSVTPSLRPIWHAQDPTPPLWTVTPLPATVSAGALGNVEIPEKRLTTVLWPGQFVAYKQFQRTVPRQVVGGRPMQQIVTWPGRGTLEEQQRELAIYLDRLVDTADTVCRLDDSQREKLRLAGRIDIDRFGQDYRALEALDAKDPLAKRERKLSSLSYLAPGMFAEPASNYQKAVVARLTADQARKLAAAEEERYAFYRQAIVEAVVVGFERSASLTSAQCVELTRILNDAVSGCDSPRQWRNECLRTIIELPEEKLRPMVANEQWRAIKQQLWQLAEISRELEAEAAGGVAVFREMKIRVLQAGPRKGEVEVEAKELILDLD